MNIQDFFSHQFVSHLQESREFLVQLLRDYGSQIGAAMAAAIVPIQDRLSRRYYHIAQAYKAVDFEGHRASMPRGGDPGTAGRVGRENLEALELIQGS